MFAKISSKYCGSLHIWYSSLENTRTTRTQKPANICTSWYEDMRLPCELRIFFFSVDHPSNYHSFFFIFMKFLLSISFMIILYSQRRARVYTGFSNVTRSLLGSRVPFLCGVHVVALVCIVLLFIWVM